MMQALGGEPNAADQWVKSITNVTGSGVAYTEQDVTPSCDVNLRYIMWNVGCQDEIHPLRHQNCWGGGGELRPDLRRNSDDRGRVEESTQEMICTRGFKM